MAIQRYSSRTRKLDQSFLAPFLEGARSYKRIAGYFTSSLFEVADELLEAIPDIRIVCNADLRPEDVKVAQSLQARMLGRWNEHAVEVEALKNRPRYQRLDQFLTQRGPVIRVAPDEVCGFVHGKAGVIELADGRKLGFIGSMNETSSGWRRHYEILWSDASPEGVAWIEQEFDYLWHAARPLPEAILKEVKRRSRRYEIVLEDVASADDLAPAALIESPLYREGMSLQPWQQGFVTEVLKHYRLYGKVRLLLADEVGLGKTLSLGVAALSLCLLAEKDKRRRKPVIIFAPATLCEQWQTEMMDKLGIPCARWHTLKKCWWDPDGRALSPEGTRQIARCPLRIGIVSTGLMGRESEEKAHLLDLRLELVVVDEAHKARTRQGFGREAGRPNNLLAFLRDIAARAEHVILGTATPIQTRVEDLWDLVGVLNQGVGRDFVLGDVFTPWHDPQEVKGILSGQVAVDEPERAWKLLRCPLPPVEASEDDQTALLYRNIRDDLGLLGKREYLGGAFTDLDPGTREDLEMALEQEKQGTTFFQRENPFVRHVVLRKRTTLEEQGLLKRIAVDIHPNPRLVRKIHEFHGFFSGLGLRTPDDFKAAYDEARRYGQAVSQRRSGGAGFMKNLMEQRICSSIHAGVSTAEKLLRGETIEEEQDEETLVLSLDDPIGAERSALERLRVRLSQVKEDPKLRVILHYLVEEKWLDHGVIIFSQYYDTAHFVAAALATAFPNHPLGLYAGAGKSRLFYQHESNAADREHLKRMVADHEIRIMVATDAACEGLNLQTLGTLINVDLPWNPTKLEQRIGRIKRFGQARDKVDMLNLVNEQTVDERVYERLSERMRDKFDLFGSLPDTIKDEWIEDIETLGEKMDEYIDAQKEATGFDLRYNATLRPSDQDWRDCYAVLSQQDFGTIMREGW